MDISKAQEKFEALFGEVVMGTPGPISQTGELYIEVLNDGPRKEEKGSQIYDFLTDKWVAGRTIHLNAADAVEQWLEEVTKMASAIDPKSHTLYWRIIPEVDCKYEQIYAQNGMFRMPTYAVYSCFLISNKPRITEASHG